MILMARGVKDLNDDVLAIVNNIGVYTNKKIRIPNS